MSVIGKIHEISLYGLISTIICFVKGRLTVMMLWEVAFSPKSFTEFFISYLFWATVLFIPIAVVGAIVTKFVDGGEGLTFSSDNIIVIIFSHIAEELLGLFLTPVWFLRDLIRKDFDMWKVIDYTMYALELVFIVVGMMFLFN